MKIEISPLTRLEGHAKVVIKLDERGQIESAKFMVLGFRGFEKILVGRPIEEAPRIASRICGICQVAHSMASAKAAENALEITPPEDAIRLRRIMHYAGIIQSHLLHLIFLALPDYLEFKANDPLEMLLKEKPEIVKSTITARTFSQEIVELTGGKSIHPVLNAVGGVLNSPDNEKYRKLVIKAKNLVKILNEIVEKTEEIFYKKAEELREIFEMNTLYIALVNKNNVDFYEGELCIKNSNILEKIPPDKYSSILTEKTIKHTYIKYPYVKTAAKEELTRVGPLARYNVSNIKTENNMLYYNISRLKECLQLAEEIEKLVDRPFKEKPYTAITFHEGEGVGVVEAPRGLLIHHYRCDEKGLITKANIIVPTTINAPSIEESIKIVSARCIKNGNIDKEKLKYFIGLAVRSYDPCLSCATHTETSAPLIKVVDYKGRVLALL